MKDLLDILNKEAKQEKKELLIEKDKTLESLLNIWDEVAKQYLETRPPYQFYNRCELLLKHLFQNNREVNFDIQKFLLTITNNQSEKYFKTRIGLFLSAYINCHKDKKIKIYIDHFKETPNYIGFWNNIDPWNNGKEITVYGDVGFGFGYKMKSGRIILNGNVDDWLGTCLEGGRLDINGNFSRIANCIGGGDIYHKGMLIVKDGKKI